MIKLYHVIHYLQCTSLVRQTAIWYLIKPISDHQVPEKPEQNTNPCMPRTNICEQTTNSYMHNTFRNGS